MKTQGSWVRVVKFVGVTGTCLRSPGGCSLSKRREGLYTNWSKNVTGRSEPSIQKSLPRKMIPSGAQPMASCR